MLILGVSAPVSGIIDNIPYIATMTPIVSELAASMPDLAHPDALWWALALGADFGGNLTAVGASANVVMLGIARRADNPISFWEFTRKGALITVVRSRCPRSTCGCATSCSAEGRIMSVVLTIVLIAFCIQGLVKFAVGFLLPYSTQRRHRAYSHRTNASSASTTRATLAIISRSSSSCSSPASTSSVSSPASSSECS